MFRVYFPCKTDISTLFLWLCFSIYPDISCSPVPPVRGQCSLIHSSYQRAWFSRWVFPYPSKLCYRCPSIIICSFLNIFLKLLQANSLLSSRCHDSFSLLTSRVTNQWYLENWLCSQHCLDRSQWNRYDTYTGANIPGIKEYMNKLGHWSLEGTHQLPRVAQLGSDRAVIGTTLISITFHWFKSPGLKYLFTSFGKNPKRKMFLFYSPAYLKSEFSFQTPWGLWPYVQ